MSSKAEEQHSDQQEWSVSAYRAQEGTGEDEAGQFLLLIWFFPLSDLQQQDS